MIEMGSRSLERRCSCEMYVSETYFQEWRIDCLKKLSLRHVFLLIKKLLTFV